MTTPDCLCAICGCCQHDHNGWYHKWVAKFPWEESGRGSVRERLRATGARMQKEIDDANAH